MPSSSKPNLGTRAEQQVGEWLTAAGWELLHHRWHCRWGELDWVAIAPAQPPDPRSLVFVEVKARSRGSWDANGLQAITPAKQARLWQTAEVFLAEFPDLAVLPCRFDVVLVRQTGDRLHLHQHIIHAFEQ
ncbi:MAG: YraN family protein [Cyanobacteria bacterium J06638_22]